MNLDTYSHMCAYSVMMIHDFVCKTEHIVRDLRHGEKK